MIKGTCLFQSSKEITSVSLSTLKKIDEHQEINQIYIRMMNRDQNQRISAKLCLEEFEKLLSEDIQYEDKLKK